MGELISDALNNIMNAEKVSKSECKIKYTSKFLAKILDILVKNGYIKGYEVIKNTL